MMRSPVKELETVMWKIDNDSFEQLMSGRKKVEIKIASSATKEVQEKKNMIIFFGHDGSKFTIVRRTKFKDFDDLLSRENPEDIYPGKTKEEVLEDLRKRFPRSKEKFGVYAYELVPFVPRRPVTHISYAQ